MSIRGAAARSDFVFTGDVNLSDIQQARSDLARKVNANPLSNAVVLDGLVQTDGSTSDGIFFTPGQSIELSHGLGRRAAGFVVIDSQDGPAQLGRFPVTAGLENTHIKLTHDALAPSNVRVKLAVY